MRERERIGMREKEEGCGGDGGGSQVSLIGSFGWKQLEYKK